VRRDSAGIALTENWPVVGARAALIVDSVPSVVLGTQSSMNFQFTRIDIATRLSSGVLAVVDGGLRGQIRLFSADGRAVSVVGRVGQGPGEYAGITSLLRGRADTLIVGDSQQGRLTLLRSDGSTIRVVQLPLLQAPRNPATAPPPSPSAARVRFTGLLDDGSMLGTIVLPGAWANDPRRGARVDTTRLRLLRVRPGTDGVDTIADLVDNAFYHRPTADTPNGRTGTNVPFVRRGSFTPVAGGYLVTDGTRYEITKGDTRGRTVELIRICRPIQPVTSDDVRRFQAEYVATALPAARSRFTQTARSIPYPRNRPALTQLLHDGTGRIWARTYTHPSDPQHWYILGPQGDLLGEVLTPSGLEVLEVGPDYLLATATSSDMVETLRVYAVRERVP
jgi:hypothetical protein